jgi:hypothetical protein
VPGPVGQRRATSSGLTHVTGEQRVQRDRHLGTIEARSGRPSAGLLRTLPSIGVSLVVDGSPSADTRSAPLLDTASAPRRNGKGYPQRQPTKWRWPRGKTSRVRSRTFSSRSPKDKA